MKSEQDNWVDAAKNAISGYGAVVLGIVCFILALLVIVAIVRLAVGMSASV